MVVQIVITLASLVALTLPSASAQYKMTAPQYIEKYKSIAINNMNKHGIPSSITLAQGILESGNGGGRLAVEANNHFGIKCKGSWTGGKIYHDDDEKGECFRKYASPEESYDDHSQFLTSSQRYASLFTLKNTDYKGWAKGLKAAGYATNPQYAELLIGLIERYQLHQYDTAAPSWDFKTPAQSDQEFLTKKLDRKARTWGQLNGAIYVVAREGDTYTKIARNSGRTTSEVLTFNDLQKDAQGPTVGEKVFVTRKKGRTERSILFHRAAVGESARDIAQLYGIRLKTLVRKNPSLLISTPKEGQIIRLR